MKGIDCKENTCTHLSPFSKRKFNLKSDRIYIGAPAVVLLSVCFIYPMSGTGKVDLAWKCTTTARAWVSKDPS